MTPELDDAIYAATGDMKIADVIPAWAWRQAINDRYGSYNAFIIASIAYNLCCDREALKP